VLTAVILVLVHNFQKTALSDPLATTNISVGSTRTKTILPYLLKTFNKWHLPPWFLPENGQLQKQNDKPQPKTQNTILTQQQGRVWHWKNDNVDDNKDDNDNDIDNKDNKDYKDEIIKNTFPEVKVQLVSDKNNFTGMIDLLVKDACNRTLWNFKCCNNKCCWYSSVLGSETL